MSFEEQQHQQQSSQSSSSIRGAAAHSAASSRCSSVAIQCSTPISSTPSSPTSALSPPLPPPPLAPPAPPLYENVHQLERLTDLYHAQYIPATCSNADTASINSASTKNIDIDIDASSKALNDGSKTSYNTLDSKSRTQSMRRTIDMRPLSIPEYEYKRRISRTERRCCICLSIATIIVFAIAFTIWLLFGYLAIRFD